MLSARNRLKRHLNEVDSTSSSLSSPIQRSLKVAAVQSHAREVSSLTANESPDAHTPGTKTFLTTINALESVAGSKCLVKDPEAAVLEIAEKYLDSDSGCVSRFAKKELFAEPSRLPPYGNAQNRGCCPAAETSKNKHPPKELPSNSTGRRVSKSAWEGVPILNHSSVANAISRVDGLGPTNAFMKKTSHTKNGFVVKEYTCKNNHSRKLKKGSDGSCSFRARVFHPVNDHLRVCTQVMHGHTCKCLDWKAHLQNNHRKGMHPKLKECIDAEIDKYPLYNPPKPDAMVNRMFELHGHDLNDAFPPSCRSIVTAQIRDYTKRQRSFIAKNAPDESKRVCMEFVEHVQHFRKNHQIYLPKSFQKIDFVKDIVKARELAKSVLTDATKTLIPPNIKRGEQPEHEMFVHPMPPVNDPDLGSKMEDAMKKDSELTELKSIVPFSSINLLRQATVAHKKWKCQLMACTDSTHNADIDGRKLMSFGYISHEKRGNKGSEYSHRYYPLVFAQTNSENEEAATYMLCALLFIVRQLFGFLLDVKGGLISDHATCFINSFKKVFPGQPIGQCYPHIFLKVQDQRGRRKRSAPGYNSRIVNKEHCPEMARDVQCMHECRTAEMRTTYANLALEAWSLVLNEEEVSRVFRKSYIDSADHNRWRYNDFGNIGDSPQGNSIERTHLTIKGSKQFDGLCNLGRSMAAVLYEEYPRMVFQLSSSREEIDRAFRIGDYEGVTRDSDLLSRASRLSLESDVICLTKDSTVSDKRIYLVNNEGWEGTPVDEDRLLRRELSLQGKFPSMDYTKRHEFFEAGTSLCKVEYKAGPLGDMEWHCDCVCFWKTAACQHTYLLKYGTPKPLNVPVQKRRGKRTIQCNNKKPRKTSQPRFSGFAELATDQAAYRGQSVANSIPEDSSILPQLPVPNSLYPFYLSSLTHRAMPMADQRWPTLMTMPGSQWRSNTQDPNGQSK